MILFKDIIFTKQPKFKHQNWDFFYLWFTIKGLYRRYREDVTYLVSVHVRDILHLWFQELVFPRHIGELQDVQGDSSNTRLRQGVETGYVRTRVVNLKTSRFIKDYSNFVFIMEGGGAAVHYPPPSLISSILLLIHSLIAAPSSLYKMKIKHKFISNIRL